MHRHKSVRMQGFTLLELLITLSLFGAIMAFLTTSFFQFQDQNRRAESIFQLRQESRILERIIREDLQNVLFLYGYMSGGTKDLDQRKSGLYGISEEVGELNKDAIHMHVARSSRFHRSVPFQRDPVVHEISYFLEEVEQDQLHLKRREDFYIDLDITEGEESIVYTISENVRSFDIKYYKAKSLDALDEWDSTEVYKRKEHPLPAGIYVTIELENEKGEKLKTDFQVNLNPDMGVSIKWR
jgi:prepilin-type N-terminal cleavage/methylation domain-containing protein